MPKLVNVSGWMDDLVEREEEENIFFSNGSFLTRKSSKMNVELLSGYSFFFFSISTGIVHFKCFYLPVLS